VIFIEYDEGMISTSHPVLRWANNLLLKFLDRRAMVVSHNVLQGGTSNAFSTQGAAIYHALKVNPNLFLILGGHLDIAARRLDTFGGNTIYTLRSDYQFVNNHQSGYLRILRFNPARNTIRLHTYSDPGLPADPTTSILAEQPVLL
jgi:thymidylate kinase